MLAYPSPKWMTVSALMLGTLCISRSASATGGDAFATEAASVTQPGAFKWNGADSGHGPIRVLVDIASQHVFVYRGAALVGVSTVSTGGPGHETPIGTFRILQKDAAHRSRTYDNAPMPYMLRLTWDGVALHGGRNPGYPDSHGCVRLPTAFAKKLFTLARLGAVVTVQEDGAPVVEPPSDPVPVEPVPPEPTAPIVAPPVLTAPSILAAAPQ